MTFDIVISVAVLHWVAVNLFHWHYLSIDGTRTNLFLLGPVTMVYCMITSPPSIKVVNRVLSCVSSYLIPINLVSNFNIHWAFILYDVTKTIINKSNPSGINLVYATLEKLLNLFTSNELLLDISSIARFNGFYRLWMQLCTISNEHTNIVIEWKKLMSFVHSTKGNI